MNDCHKYILLLFIILLPLSAIDAAGKESPHSGWRFNEITILENGFLEKSAGDPFIVFPEITVPTCGPMGVQLSLSFNPIPQKPLLLEIFWSTDYLGFGEENKVFFIVHPKDHTQPMNLFVPLDHTAGIRQVRLDFPSHINTQFTVTNYDVLPLNDAPLEFEKVDAYYNLPIDDSLNPKIMVPYLLKALGHGPRRLLHDPTFVIFWGGIILLILFSIRKIAARIRSMN